MVKLNELYVKNSVILTGEEGIDYSNGVISQAMQTLTEETFIDGGSDYICFFDTSLSEHKKILSNSLVDGGSLD